MVARTLGWLGTANRLLGLSDEGLDRMEKSLKTLERLKNNAEQADAWNEIAHLRFEAGRLDDAEAAASCAVKLTQGTDQENLACRSHRLLGNIYHFKGRVDEARHNFQVALGIALNSSWQYELFWIHYSMAYLFLDEAKFDIAQDCVEKAKSSVVEDA